MTNALQVVDTLSLIESIDINKVSGTISKVRQLQATMKGILTAKHDYDTIPGCGKKEVLLKPGAEKILMALGITSTYELINHTENFEDKGFFAYTVKCVLYKGDAKITEGLGHANSKEKKWAFEWVNEKDVPKDIDKTLLQSKTGTSSYGNFTQYQVESDANSKANTILKMAKKRAQIDAVLTVASLSEIFTQDFEDIPHDEENPNTSTVEQVKAKTKAKSEPKTETEYTCSECGKGINEAVNKYSTGKFNKPLCYDCQQAYKD